MIKNIVNILAVGCFVPFLATFYLLNGQTVDQVFLSAVYGLILALAIRLND